MKTLFIVLLILSVLALIPVGIDGGWASGRSVVLSARIGFIRFTVFPRKQKEGAQRRSKPKTGRKTGGTAALDRGGTLALIKAVLRALGRLRRKLRVSYLRFRFTVASSDPFKTALGFGICSGAAAGFVPLLDSAFNIEQRDIGPAFDFTAAEPQTDVWITASILLWQLFYVADALGNRYLKIKKHSSAKAKGKTEMV